MTNGLFCSPARQSSRIEGEGERHLRPGDHALIAANRAHRVTWTAKNEPTILAGRIISSEFTSAIDALADVPLTQGFGRC